MTKDNLDKSDKFFLQSPYKPAGDQPQAISKLVEGLNQGLSYQTLLGVTGSGKTFSIANVIASVQKSTLILAHNKTLAAQLYSELKEFFPNNAVEYFVSYFDYYQPEAYVPASDTYIAKDSSVNNQIDQLRLSATKSLMERRDVILVATVSAIYGLGDPTQYLKMILQVRIDDKIKTSSIAEQLVTMRYTRNETILERGHFRMRGDVVDIYPAESDELAVRIELFDDEVEKISWFDPLTGELIKQDVRVTVYPKNHFVTPQEQVDQTVASIKEELKMQLDYFRANEKLVEAQRLEERCKLDMEMMMELGYCQGIENYSRYLSDRPAGSPPATLMDYLPEDALLIVDESHTTIPQLGGMYKGDRARKENLVRFGFRLPSALDNRPLRFDEFEKIIPQTIFVSATPAEYELNNSAQIVEQVVRPTGLLDPEVIIKPVSSQVDDLILQIKDQTKKGNRVLVTTLTKKMAEDLSEYIKDLGIKGAYLHSDIDTVERIEIIQNLRLGIFDVLIGINLLREGLDIPEVALIAILNADKEGFLRSARSLIQTMGRAARNPDGVAILYADSITKSMQKAIDETTRRRQKQIDFNTTNNITPQALNKKITNMLDTNPYSKKSKRDNSNNPASLATSAKPIPSPKNFHNLASLNAEIKKHEKSMYKAAKDLEFEEAAMIRNHIHSLKEQLTRI